MKRIYPSGSQKKKKKTSGKEEAEQWCCLPDDKQMKKTNDSLILSSRPMDFWIEHVFELPLDLAYFFTSVQRLFWKC